MPVIAVGEFVVFEGTALKLTVKLSPVTVVDAVCEVIEAEEFPLLTVINPVLLLPVVVSLLIFAVAPLLALAAVA